MFDDVCLPFDDVACCLMLPDVPSPPTRRPRRPPPALPPRRRRPSRVASPGLRPLRRPLLRRPRLRCRRRAGAVLPPRRLPSAGPYDAYLRDAADDAFACAAAASAPSSSRLVARSPASGRTFCPSWRTVLFTHVRACRFLAPHRSLCHSCPAVRPLVLSSDCSVSVTLPHDILTHRPCLASC